MKHVTFAVPQAPFGVGDKRLVPDDVAAQLQRDQIVSEVGDWPAAGASDPAAAKPVRPMLKPLRPIGKPRDHRQAR